MQAASRESLAELRERLTERISATDDAETLRTSAEELFAVIGLLTDSPSLRRVLSDPAMGAERKTQTVDRLLGSRLAEATVGLVRDAVRARWSEPIDLVDAVEALAVGTLLAVAERGNQLGTVEDQLFRFERIVDATPELRAALVDRSLPDERKTELLDRLLEGRALPVTRRLVEQAVRHPRGRTFERTLEEFNRMVAARRDRLVAVVRSARPLGDDLVGRLTDALSRHYGQDMTLHVEVDRELVGGLTVQVGDEMIDASVVRQLAQARRQLTGRRR